MAIIKTQKNSLFVVMYYIAMKRTNKTGHDLEY